MSRLQRKSYHEVYVSEGADLALRLLQGYVVCGSLFNCCRGTYSDFVMRKEIKET